MLKLNLLENALDFILDAVEQLKDAEEQPRRIKYAILHLCSGIELLLKERLQREHWSLILEDVDNANRDAFDKGKSRTVGFKQAITRLKQICEIEFEKHLQVLGKLGDLRNKIIHFKIDISVDEGVSVLVKAWSFILHFESEHLDLTEDVGAGETFEQIRQGMVEHQTFVDEREREIEPELAGLRGKGLTIIDCPYCLQDALLVDGGTWDCHFCKRRTPWEEAADKWLASHEGWRYLDPKEHFIEPVIQECPECGAEALYQFEDWDMMPPDPGWVCLHCGENWSWNGIVSCVRCGRPMAPIEEGDSMCCFPDV